MSQVNVKDVKPVFADARKRETVGSDRDGTASLVARRQAQLREAYERDPDQAIVTKRARAVSAADADALHGSVLPGNDYGVRWEVVPWAGSTTHRIRPKCFAQRWPPARTHRPAWSPMCCA